MSIERDEASALLHDVESIESRVRQLLIYARVSDYLFLWGAILGIGFTANYFLRHYSDALWYAFETAGLLGTIAIVALHRRAAQNRNSFVYLRAALSVAAVTGFGTLWIHLTDMGWREQVTFWPTLLSFFLFLIGLWLGRSLALAALAIFALSLAGYFVAGPYLHLWMAVATGGSMIAGGVWLRR
ncbi:MAG TPA: hypothetical protein VHZ78_00105 [Rhizomicrobium sp.]|jgi:hypothetical protein|nr:hypothetical protein [Rhizomicrobium sp.]